MRDLDAGQPGCGRGSVQEDCEHNLRRLRGSRPGRPGGEREDRPQAHLRKRGDHALGGVGEPSGDKALPAGRVGGPAGTERAAPRLGQRVDLALVERHQVRAVSSEVEVVPQHTLQVVGRILLARRHDRQQDVHRLVQERREDLVLAGEVSIDGWSRQASASADLVDTDPVETSLLEGLGRGIENPAPSVHRATLTRSWRSVRELCQMVRPFSMTAVTLCPLGARSLMCVR